MDIKWKKINYKSIDFSDRDDMSEVEIKMLLNVVLMTNKQKAL